MSGAGLATTEPITRTAAEPIRVMLVDDSGVSRALMTRWIEESGTGIVVAAVTNGRAAIDALASVPVDVVLLDIEMPELDGLSALPQLLAKAPGMQVLMVSMLTLRSAEATIEALRLGAADTLAKPQSGWVGSGPDFQTELIEKIRALGEAARRMRTVHRSTLAAPVPVAPRERYDRAKPSSRRARAIAIGASTGGPNALLRLIDALPRDLSAPIFITQHMPPTFTAVFAEHLAHHAKRPAAEASDGMIVRPGHIYVAPGSFHMSVVGTALRPIIAISDAPPENFCRPSVNPLMRSVAEVYGAAALGVMLTGMGSDGLDGARAIVSAGGTVIVQDQSTSVVWGMPGAVARAGLASDILPLDTIPLAVERLLRPDTQ